MEARQREDNYQARNGLKFGCVNVRGWGVDKFEDLGRELNEWRFDAVGVTETQLRDDVRMEGSDYVLIGKGRKKQERLGGGVAFLHRKESNLKVEELDVGSSAMSEDILVLRVECAGKHDRHESFVVAVVYMTVEGERAVRENGMKYDVLRGLVRRFAGEKVMIMGDMNAHLGMLGERINRNGEMLAEFIDEMSLENLNETVAEGRVTWNARNQESAIDYVLVNGKMRESVARMWIDEDGVIDVVSDHNMLVVECLTLGGKTEVKVKKKKRKWRLRDANWENFQVCLSEKMWNAESVQDVDELNERLIDSVRSAGESKIGFVRMSGKKRKNKPWWNEDIKDARRRLLLSDVTWGWRWTPRMSKI